MQADYDLRHPHRRNQDGSFDSICLTCFLTIGHEPCEADLREKEASHHCGTLPLPPLVPQRHWSDSEPSLTDRK